MAERLRRGAAVSRASLFGAGFAALLAVLTTNSWFEHVDRLQERLRLEATEMVQMADALAWQSGSRNTIDDRAAAGSRGSRSGRDETSNIGGGGSPVGALADIRRLAAQLEQRLPYPTGFCRLRGRDGQVLLERGRRSGMPTLSAAQDGSGTDWLEGRSHSQLTGFTASSVVSLDRAIALWAGGNAAPGALLVGAGLMMLTMLGRLETARADLRRASRHALQDALTGIPNRRAFDAAFQRLGRATARDRRPISALFIDIDRFKQLNDQLGHAAGDRALRAVAGAIRRSLLRPTDFCCRWGGEEFVVLLPDTDTRGALQTAQRILERVRHLRARSEDSHSRPLTVSVGIASQPEGVAPGPELVLNADHAMLEAKRAGRDCWVVWRTDSHSASATLSVPEATANSGAGTSDAVTPAPAQTHRAG